VITLDSDPASPNRSCFLDYFVYKTSSTARKTLLIDDNDPGVAYSPGSWIFGTSDESLEGTQHVSTSAGSWAAVSFDGASLYILYIVECN
jgi:hypothetical protein